jgi:hypothetical protein
LREKRRLRVFEKMVFRRIFGHKRSEKSGKLSKIHEGELYDLYSSPNIIISLEVTDYITLCIHKLQSRGSMEKWK